MTHDDKFKALDNAAAVAAINPLIPAAVRVLLTMAAELVKDHERRLAALEKNLEV